jgi:hypothetical protein
MGLFDKMKGFVNPPEEDDYYDDEADYYDDIDSGSAKQQPVQQNNYN